VVAEGSPDELRAQAQEAHLEEAFIKIIAASAGELQ
jgi:hypothetical protein